MARPSSYTIKRAEEICQAIAQGETLRAICSKKGMPTRHTVFRWLNKYPEFRAQYARAREDQADSIFDEIVDEARAVTPKTANAIRVKIDGIKWAASKLKPKVYGDKMALEHTGRDGGPIQTVDLSRMTDDQLDSLEKILAGGEGAETGGGEGGEGQEAP